MTPDPAPEWDAAATVTGEYVTVDRALEPRDGGVIATLAASTDGGDPIGVRVVESIPEGWPVDEVGLHPDFEPESFVADDGSIAIEGVVRPDGEFEVVFGLRLDGDGAALDPPDEPVIERETPRPARAVDGGLLAGDGSGAVDPFTFPDAPGGSPGNDGGDASAVGDPTAAFGADSPFTDPFGLDGDAPDKPADANPGEGRAAPADGEDLEDFVGRLADAIRAGDVPEDDVVALRDAIGAEAGQSLNARLDHVNSRVEEFAAYSPFLRDLIDEHGSADAFHDHLHALADDVEAARREQRDAASERDDLRESIDTLSDDLASLEDEIDEVRGRLDDVERLEDRLDEVTDGMADEIAAVRADVEDLAGGVEEWRDARDALASTLVDEAPDAAATSSD